MKWVSYGLAGTLLLASCLLLLSAADKPPAEFKDSGAFTGGTLREGIILDGVRFGRHSGYSRMVLDFAQTKGDAAVSAAAHPVYSV